MPQVGTWSTVWRTDELDNDGASISGMVHMPGIPGLPGGDGHAGYLITAASQLLSLYECSASGGRGEASLQVPEQAASLSHCLAQIAGRQEALFPWPVAFAYHAPTRMLPSKVSWLLIRCCIRRSCTS